MLERLIFIAEPPLLSKFGNLSTCPSVQSLGGGGRESQDNPTGGGECHLSWRENARCSWTTGIFLGGKLHDHRRF